LDGIGDYVLVRFDMDAHIRIVIAIREALRMKRGF